MVGGRFELCSAAYIRGVRMFELFGGGDGGVVFVADSGDRRESGAAGDRTHIVSSLGFHLHFDHRHHSGHLGIFPVRHPHPTNKKTFFFLPPLCLVAKLELGLNWK